MWYCVYSQDTLSRRKRLRSYCLRYGTFLSTALAFIISMSTVFVDLYTPAGRFIKSRHIRDELERQLIASKKVIGWPVERLIKDLNQAWATDARETSSS